MELSPSLIPPSTPCWMVAQVLPSALCPLPCCGWDTLWVCQDPPCLPAPSSTPLSASYHTGVRAGGWELGASRAIDGSTPTSRVGSGGGDPHPVPAALTVRPCSSWTQPAGSIHSWAGPRAFFPKADVLFMFYSGVPASVLGRRRAACVWVSLLGASNQTDLWRICGRGDGLSPVPSILGGVVVHCHLLVCHRGGPPLSHPPAPLEEAGGSFKKLGGFVCANCIVRGGTGRRGAV